MSDSPLLKGYEEIKKPKVDKIAKMKARCYQALMKDFFFNRQFNFKFCKKKILCNESNYKFKNKFKPTDKKFKNILLIENWKK